MGPITVIPDILDAPDLPNADLYAALNIRTVVGASMLREGQLVGVLNIFTRGETHRFTADELMLLKGLADQAAQAITNARLHGALQREEHARANLLRKIITAQEDERNRIARELHDRTAQGLTLLMMDLDLGRKAEAIDIQTADRHFQRSRSIAEETLGDLRRIIADLRPSLLDDLGLVPAIAWYGEQRLKPLGITLQLRGNALERRLPQVMETAIFRIAQEALANTAKHSGASRVIVSIEALEGHLVMEVRDDGKGFQVPATGMAQANGDGLGLPGIKERATLLGGEFSLQTAPGQGTVITVHVPLREEVQDV
jgi:signal transduction histidine kinase